MVTYVSKRIDTVDRQALSYSSNLLQKPHFTAKATATAPNKTPDRMRSVRFDSTDTYSTDGSLVFFMSHC